MSDLIALAIGVAIWALAYWLVMLNEASQLREAKRLDALRRANRPTGAGE